ncbi:hypothetical protein [Gynuella sp.]|uniref:hypothetical protein n=1 Tax=Gynuella sp. TaxID=2969146 RepID=UPI003D0D1BBB
MTALPLREVLDWAGTAAVAKVCMSAGLIIETCGSRDQTVKVTPALAIEEKTILEQGMVVIENAIRYCLNLLVADSGFYWLSS